MSKARASTAVSTGDLFALPMIDSSFALGQVVAAATSGDVVVTAVFAYRSIDASELVMIADTHADGLTKPFSLFAHSKSNIESGRWPALGSRAPSLSNVEIDKVAVIVNTVGATLNKTWSTANAAQNAAEKFFGIIPFRPVDSKDWLAPHRDEHPSTRPESGFSGEELDGIKTLQREYLLAELRSTSRRAGKSPILHVAYSYEGRGLPTVPQLRRRHELEMLVMKALPPSAKAQLVDAGGGGGTMDMRFRVASAEAALASVIALLSPLALPDLTVESSG